MTDRYAPKPGYQLGHESGPGERLWRLRRRRRLVREEMLAVLFLLLVLTATVAVLATQWLDSGASIAASSGLVHLTDSDGGST